MKIIAIGQNYVDHNHEMRSEQPTNPVVFMKPDSAILRKNRPFYIPDFTQDLHHEVELIVKINRLGKNIARKFAHRYYAEIGLGIDFTARDLQNQLKKKGHPWEISKAFDYSAVIGDFMPVAAIENVDEIDFRLDINGETVQKANSSAMIFKIDELIAYVSQFFTLKIGDLIYTGTPAGVGPVQIGDRLQGYIFDRKMFDFNIK